MFKINCKIISQKIKDSLIEKTKNYIRKPKLATIIVGDRPDSKIYVKNKEKTLESVGFEYETFELDENVTQENLESLVNWLANNESMDGILLQLPLPKHLDANKAIELIPYYKDVDGLTEKNQAMLMLGKDWDDFIQPCTPLGIIKIIEDVCINSISSINAAVIGRSNLLGNPLAQMLMRKDATVLQLHSKSDVKESLKNFKPNVIFLCSGQKNLLTAYDIGALHLDKNLDMIIDAGIIRDDNGLRGDFKKEDYDILNSLNVNYTTVPGGVGILTTTMLAYNLKKCYDLNLKRSK